MPARGPHPREPVLPWLAPSRYPCPGPTSKPGVWSRDACRAEDLLGTKAFTLPVTPAPHVAPTDAHTQTILLLPDLTLGLAHFSWPQPTCGITLEPLHPVLHLFSPKLLPLLSTLCSSHSTPRRPPPTQPQSQGQHHHPRNPHPGSPRRCQSLCPQPHRPPFLPASGPLARCFCGQDASQTAPSTHLPGNQLCPNHRNVHPSPGSHSPPGSLSHPAIWRRHGSAVSGKSLSPWCLHTAEHTADSIPLTTKTWHESRLGPATARARPRWNRLTHRTRLRAQSTAQHCPRLPRSLQAPS